MQLNTYLEQNRTNHYKMLVIVDNNHQHEKIINALQNEGWTSYDVNENIIKIIENVPENKIKVRIGSKIKEWANKLPDRVILYNTNILYSPELGKPNPVAAFKYRTRDRECILILEGSVSGNRIQYSEYGKEDHVEMDVSELIHVKMEDIDV
ncbi:MAG: BREX-3 system P-loop-containing protein BrxF [Methanosarcinaceae archaeon]